MQIRSFTRRAAPLQLCILVWAVWTVSSATIETAQGSDAVSAAQATIERLHQELGVASDYATTSGLPLQVPPTSLVSIGKDMYGRSQRLAPEAAVAWEQMRALAKASGVSLRLVSAYRPPEYQANLLRRKLARGETIEHALKTVAAPGHSEHQSGRAIDVACAGCPVLETDFEYTDTFKWLEQNAELFGFSLSYPRGNPHGISYEPWHWCHAPQGAP